jgi:hypothetical protein
MAWSWSHTDEAYANARANLLELRDIELWEIYGEWHAADLELDENWLPKYNEHYRKAQSLGRDVLIEYIWDRAREQQTCDNGGFNAWMCPHGCTPHSVSFDVN